MGIDDSVLLPLLDDLAVILFYIFANECYAVHELYTSENICFQEKSFCETAKPCFYIDKGSIPA
ncbi:uncharacterized protein RCO7_15019 [Rhynchosporium graminicola]|uniref:Uncharacterized protein n=2 Tax=Rhynchosporium TaxID=38037 RepID=A0A1E1M762_RHYSE|nr:uncharacterized protein RCO7_15019 [Rhynchosporium commune]CZT44942.1 uncharacterized protein RSE6_05199 [Rhynchosporium secalis]